MVSNGQMDTSRPAPTRKYIYLYKTWSPQHCLLALASTLSQGNVATGRQGTRPSSYNVLHIPRSPTVESINPLFGLRARHDNDVPPRLSSVIPLPF